MGKAGLLTGDKCGHEFLRALRPLSPGQAPSSPQVGPHRGRSPRRGSADALGGGPCHSLPAALLLTLALCC